MNIDHDVELKEFNTLITHWQNKAKPLEISSQILYNLLAIKPSEVTVALSAPIIVDIRDSTEYNTHHIIKSINIPTELISDLRQLEIICPDSQKDRLKWRNLYRIVLYGSPSQSEILASLANLFVKEGKTKTVFILKDGFSVFSSHFPFRCEGMTTKTTPDAYELYPSKLFSFLFLGSFVTAKSAYQLKNLDISCIVNSTTECKNIFQDMLSYFNLMWNDDLDEPLNKLEEAYNFIINAKETNKKVLIHCMEGKSRSATMAIYFVMKYCKWNYDKAFQYVYFCRPNIDPNPHFRKRLQELSSNIV